MALRGRDIAHLIFYGALVLSTFGGIAIIAGPWFIFSTWLAIASNVASIYVAIGLAVYIYADIENDRCIMWKMLLAWPAVVLSFPENLTMWVRK